MHRWLALFAVLMIGCTPSPPQPMPLSFRNKPPSPGPGEIAPDISGTDMEEVAFKLSDYRGKVVMLDFWGDW
jgi:hypothetical protein